MKKITTIVGALTLSSFINVAIAQTEAKFNNGAGFTSPALTGTNLTGNSFRVRTYDGTVDIGAQNNNWCHFITSKPRFYFNDDVYVNGGVISAYGNAPLILGTNKTDVNGNPIADFNTRMIFTFDGKAGIGTPTPVSSFHVLGTLSTFSSNTAPTFAAAIRGNSNNSTPSTPDFTWYNNDQTGIYHPAADVIGFTNAAIETMRIDGLGRVVVGGDGVTNLPSGYKLYVTSGIYTEQVRIATYANWADYVFDEKYKLMSLDSLNQYVQENKHLPNIPSATEVKNNGIDLADMDSRLLEKIEELTLYIIQLENRIQAIESRDSNINK